MSYQAYFVSHHTRDCHVGFHSAWKGNGKINKTICYFLFASYHINKLQLSDKNVSTHSIEIFKYFHEVNQKFLCFLLFFSIPSCTKGNQQMLSNRTCVPCHANPLFVCVRWSCSLIHRPWRQGQSPSTKHKRNVVMIWNHDVSSHLQVWWVWIGRDSTCVNAPLQKSITNQ